MARFQWGGLSGSPAVLVVGSTGLSGFACDVIAVPLSERVFCPANQFAFPHWFLSLDAERRFSFVRLL